MKEKKRLLWVDKDPDLFNRNYIGMFDLIKGILMIVIMFSHSFEQAGTLIGYISQQNIVIQLLLSPLTILQYGVIPMLFMICGYGFRKQSVKKCIKKNLSYVVVPYIFVTLVVAICNLVKWLVRGGSLLSRMRYQVLPFVLGFHPGNRFFGDYFDDIGPLWFVITYILGCIYLNLVLKEEKTWAQGMILGTGCAVALQITEIPLPYCIQQVLICTCFMYAGMLFKKAKILQYKMPVYLVILVYVLYTFSRTYGGFVEFSINAFNLKGTDIIVAAIAGVVLLFLSHRLNVLQGMLADGLRWIGRHMFWFCCVHAVSHVVIPWDEIVGMFGDHLFTGILFKFVVSSVYAVVVCCLLDVAAKHFLKVGKNI